MTHQQHAHGHALHGHAVKSEPAEGAAPAPVAEEDTSLPRIPDLTLARDAHLLAQASYQGDKNKLKHDLLVKIKANHMVTWYESLAHQLSWPVDAELVKELHAAIAAKEAHLDAAIADAKQNQGESELREAHLAKANYYSNAGLKDKAVAAFRLTEEKTVAGGQKLDILFALLRLGFFYGDNALIERTLERARTLVETGGDWDRRNRLKVYQAVQHMRTRNWKKATDLLVDTLSTFTSTELFSYTQFVRYTVVLAVLSLHRVQLKSKVLNAPEVLAVIDEVPYLRDLLQSFYHSNYALFFQSLAHIQTEMRLDVYLGKHARFYVRETRIKAYAQLLESYKSVQITSLAQAFGVTPEFIDRELSRFISSGRLHCKIDKVAGIVETTRSDSKNQLYHSTIKDGDLLLNRIQKLSRVINL